RSCSSSSRRGWCQAKRRELVSGEREETRVSSLFFMTTQSRDRLKHVREAMAASGADALVLTHLPNIFYLSGFSGSNAILLVLGDALYLFTDGRYTIQAREEVPQARVRIVRTPL